MQMLTTIQRDYSTSWLCLSQQKQSNKLRSAKIPRKKNLTQKQQWLLLSPGLEDEEDVAEAADVAVGRQGSKVEENNNQANLLLGRHCQ